LSGSPFVTNQGRFVVGNRTVIASHVTKVEFNIFEDATLEIGESCIINYGSVFLCTKSIKIGNNCMIGLYSIIMDNDMHGYELENRLIRPEGDEIIIEDNVWLGARVTVLKGVTIGEGSIIAAGSVVTKSIPPRTIAGGVPARVLKDL
jgi:maltose O-acetyltransferase